MSLWHSSCSPRPRYIHYMSLPSLTLSLFLSPSLSHFLCLSSPPPHPPTHAHKGSAFCTDSGAPFKAKATFLDATHFSFVATVYGEQFTCKSEAFTFEENTGKIVLPTSSSDCLNTVLQNFGFSLSMVNLSYDQTGDKLSVNLPSIPYSMDLKLC